MQILKNESQRNFSQEPKLKFVYLILQRPKNISNPLFLLFDGANITSEHNLKEKYKQCCQLEPVGRTGNRQYGQIEHLIN